jgi:hypothetical protein
VKQPIRFREALTVLHGLIDPVELSVKEATSGRLDPRAIREGRTKDASQFVSSFTMTVPSGNEPAVAHAQSSAGPPAGNWNKCNMLLGHASVQTTEPYLGTKQDLVNAPNDGIKLKFAV